MYSTHLLDCLFADECRRQHHMEHLPDSLYMTIKRGTNKRTMYALALESMEVRKDLDIMTIGWTI